MSRTLLIDGDIVAYQFAAAAEETMEMEGGVIALHADPAVAKENADAWIASCLRKLEGTHAVVVLTDSTNWRKKVLRTYKDNRSGTRKPLILSHVRQHLIDNHGAKIKPGLEGDDVMGILSTHPTLIKGEKIIVSADKDMRTIPGLFCRYGIGEGNAIETITEEMADHFHMIQTLTGDPTDGYKGCPGIGIKKATTILSSGPAWPAVVEAYEKAKLTEEDALVQARVARILRHTDFNFHTGEPILWSPRPA